MLRLDDRLRLAMGHNMGAQLTPEEVKQVAGWLVALRLIAQRRVSNGANLEALKALGDMKAER